MGIKWSNDAKLKEISAMFEELVKLTEEWQEKVESADDEAALAVAEKAAKLTKKWSEKTKASMDAEASPRKKLSVRQEVE